MANQSDTSSSNRRAATRSTRHGARAGEGASMSSEEFEGLGFAPGSVRGVRSFRVDKFGRLTGVTYKKVWTPGENNAECLAAGFSFDISGYISSMQATAQAIASLQTLNVNPPAVGGYSNMFSRRGRAKQTSIPPRPAPKEPAEAVAPIPSIEPIPAPIHGFGDCTCGFYGYFDGSDDYHDLGRISAVVEAYGEVVIGTRGFRAMKARILALRVKPEDDGVNGAMARKISNNYKDVAIFDSFAAMISEFPPDTSLEPSPDTDPDFWTRT